MSIGAATAKAPAPLPPVEPGWGRIDRWASSMGVYDFWKPGPVVEDIRFLEPDKALKTCLLYKADPEKYGGAFLTCQMFVYPSTRTLSQSPTALAIYEARFASARSPVERLEIAVKKSTNVLWEFLQHGNADTLNQVVVYSDEYATLGELFAFYNNSEPALVQWIIDRGAKLCSRPPGETRTRFSCAQFYLMADASKVGVPGEGATNRPFLETLDVLERSGYRPNGPQDMKWAVSETVRGPSPAMRRFIALFSPDDRRKIDQLAAPEIASKQAGALAKQREQQAREASAMAASRDAAARLSQPGTTICRTVYQNGEPFLFRAYVEGSSGTRLQLRTASLRNGRSELDNYPYADTRVSPGSVFWDDAVNWRSSC